MHAWMGSEYNQIRTEAGLTDVERGFVVMEWTQCTILNGASISAEDNSLWLCKIPTLAHYDIIRGRKINAVPRNYHSTTRERNFGRKKA